MVYFQSIKASPSPSGPNANAVPFFDRLYPAGHSIPLGYVATGLVTLAILTPAAALPGMSADQALETGAMYAETLGIAVGFSLSLKSVVFRYRPYAYSAAPAAFANPDIVNSFPSNHTTLAFASAIFAGYVFDSSHPDSPYRWAVWGAGLSLATTTAVLRVLSGDHFLSDVVAGAALGAACGFIVPRLHTIGAGEPRPGGTGLSFELLPDGATLKLSFAP